MSFLIDPPLLFISGALLYIISKRFKMERLTKIALALLIVLCFISFSLLLYLNRVDCIFPVVCPDCEGTNCSAQFMFHTNGPLIHTHIEPNKVPSVIVLFLFAIYPLWIYFGYAFALLFSKRRILKEITSLNVVKSKERSSKVGKYKIIRYPDPGKNINNQKEAIKWAVEGIRDPDKTDMDGLKSFINPGDKVLIKINICGGVPDNESTFTSRELVENVIELVKDAGGKPIICDADMIWTKFWPNAKAMGYTNEWAENHGAELKNLSETELLAFDLMGDGKGEIVSKEMIDGDVIISIPKMKTHLLTDVTLGMKNMYGTLPDIDKAKYHKKGINEIIYCVNNAFSPTITIIDGSVGGEGVGPLSCNPIKDFNTIVVSNNVALADSVASKLMGFQDPFGKIKHLKLAKDNNLIIEIPPDLDLEITEFLKKEGLQEYNKYGNWDLPDENQEAPNFYNDLTEKVVHIPGMDTLFNIGADFFLYDAARIPFLKYINICLLQVLYDLPKFWVKPKEDITTNKGMQGVNKVIFYLAALISIYLFSVYYLNPGHHISLNNNYSIFCILGYALIIVLGSLFAVRMKTNHLLAIIIISISLGFIYETSAVLAGWWSYFESNIKEAPLFPPLALPLFITVIIGLSHFFRSPIKFLGFSGNRFKLAPYAIICIFLFVFVYLEKFQNNQDPKDIEWIMVIIYLVFALFGLYFNIRHSLDSNMALALVSIALGGTMELLGFMGGLWKYGEPMQTSGEHILIFACLAWAFIVWAVCGISLIFGIDLADPFE